MTWSEFKTKYRNEIRVGLIVLIVTMAMRIIRDILKNK